MAEDEAADARDEAVDAAADDWEKIAREPGTAMNLPILDLSGVRDRSELKCQRLVNVGLALVPEDIPDLLSGVACINVGAVLPVPAGTKVETRIGQTEMSGSALAAGDDKPILMVIGQVVVTPPVTRVGYRSVALIGQIVLPKEAEALLTGKVISQVGQIAYYDGLNPRVFFEDTRLARAFFDLVDKPETLVLLGDTTFAADVTPELFRAKVAGVAIIGDVTLENADLRSVLQFLARTQFGEIHVAS